MSIWNKILAGLIVVTAVVFFYFAARVLKTHEHWHTAYLNHQKAIEQTKEQIRRTIDGGEEDGKPVDGIRQLKMKVQALTIRRGQMWTKCVARVVDPQAGKVAVTFDSAPTTLAAKSVVYCFEAADAKAGGRYMGEFRVTEAADKQLGLQPTTTLGKRELERLASTKGPWVIYNTMPLDTPNAFAGLDAKQIKEMIRDEAVIPQYLRDGKPADAKDPKDRVVNGKYTRPLRDYAKLFSNAFRDSTEIADLIYCADVDTGMIQRAIAEAKEVVTLLKKESSDLAAAIKRHTAERDAVAAHLKKVDAAAAEREKRSGELIPANQRLAAEIAAYQSEAVRRIDERTTTMAQSGATR
jgi:hypothetical protein